MKRLKSTQLLDFSAKLTVCFSHFALWMILISSSSQASSIPHKFQVRRQMQEYGTEILPYLSKFYYHCYSSSFSPCSASIAKVYLFQISTGWQLRKKTNFAAHHRPFDTLQDVWRIASRVSWAYWEPVGVQLLLLALRRAGRSAKAPSKIPSASFCHSSDLM